jgi:hypothetical protein
MAILMAIVMQRYFTAHISQWRRSGAFKKATKTAIRQALAPIASIGHTNAGCFFDFIVKKGLS